MNITSFTLSSMNRNIVCYLIFTLLLLASCKEAATENASDIGEEGMPSDFENFYEQFHSDTVFQLEHIVFPLQGLPDFASTEIIKEDKYYHKKAEWKCHQKIDPDSEMDQEFVQVSDSFIIEYIRHAKENLTLERRFAKMDDGWFLIYYVGLNQRE